MTIEEVRDLRKQLEEWIVGTLRDFEDETNLVILTVDIERIIPEEIEKVRIVVSI